MTDDLATARKRHVERRIRRLGDFASVSVCAHDVHDEWPCDAARFRDVGDELADLIRALRLEYCDDHPDKDAYCPAHPWLSFGDHDEWRAALAKWEAST